MWFLKDTGQIAVLATLTQESPDALERVPHASSPTSYPQRQKNSQLDQAKWVGPTKASHTPGALVQGEKLPGGSACAWSEGGLGNQEG